MSVNTNEPFVWARCVKMECVDRFANEKDDDLRGMESSYSQQLKEDAVRYK